MPDPDQPTLVYIVARGHSGSTLLELLLNRSEDTAAMGEIDMLGLQIFRDEKTRWVGRCSCESRIYECPYWSKIIQKVKDRYSVDLINAPFSWRISDVGAEEEYGIKRPLAYLWYKFHRLIRRIAYRNNRGNAGPFNKTYRQWIENRDFVAQHYAKLRNVSVVIDSSKDPLQMRDILKYSKMNVKVLYLTRDVRALVWSAIRRYQHSVEKEAKDWRRLNKLILSLLSGVNREDWLHVKYEDLCNDSESELARIHQFIGVERKPLSPNQEKARRHTVGGNKIRFKDLNSVREDLAWKENLSQEQLSQIQKITGDILDKLDYKF